MTKRGCAALATNRSTAQRVLDEPAFVLHHYDWSESSLILEVFTRHWGRVALVAKGAKRPTSQLRAVLLPLQPITVNFGGEGEIRTLKAADWAGGHVMLLRDIGFLPDLGLQTLTLQPLQTDKSYALLAEAGLRASSQSPFLSGTQWLQLHAALEQADALTRLLRVCAQWSSEDRAALQTQLRNLLHYHCGVNSLRTRQVMMELQAL